MSKEKKELRREGFNSFLFTYYLTVLRTEGNYEQIENGKLLNRKVEFYFTDCPNRLSDNTVPNKLWKQMIYRHIIHQNYN